MLSWLPAPILGAIMMLLLTVNTVFWVGPLYVIFLLKLLTPSGSKARDALSRAASWIAQTWAVCNTAITAALQKIEWKIDIHFETDPQGQYLVCANHQTWNDIFVLMHTFGRRAPFFKFFLKQELIWVPLLGLAWWGLDYPFMKRSTAEDIKKNPALKGKDIETTRKACEKYRNQPVLILNFLEGTRFTKTKHANTKSPYQSLLRPKAGGFAFALEAMGDKLHDLLDVTIAYPGGAVGFWDFLCGRMRKVRVDVRKLELPEDLLRGLISGEYEVSPDFRRRFQTWIAELWAQKDRRIQAMLAT
ncbi:MAG TPA: acyltransferase [Nevskiaceae bacterium]|nr:acyltransferase [Nevskiaceae bacterium]